MIFLDPWDDVVAVNRASFPNYGIPGGTLNGYLTIPHR